MMGGLRSMVEIGFSMVALGNFGTQTWQLLKKIVAFLVKTSQTVASKVANSSFINERVAGAVQKLLMISPSSKSSNLTKVLFGFRILSAIGKI